MWNLKKIISGLICLWIVLITAGCSQHVQNYKFHDTIHKDPLFDDPSYRVAGKSVNGRQIRYSVHGKGPDTIFIMGGIHGNEISSVKLVKQLEDYLAHRPYMAAGKKIIVMPVANPDGYANKTRQNANNIDLNRNFTTSNRINNNINGRNGLSEPESRAIASIIKKYRPSRIISVHSPLGCVDYDGYSRDLARKMSIASKLPVRKLGSRPGSLGSYAGIELGIPIVTFEATEKDDKLNAQNLWKKYGKAMLVAINYRNYAK